jgi:hypothetical protein
MQEASLSTMRMRLDLSIEPFLRAIARISHKSISGLREIRVGRANPGISLTEKP